MSVVLRNPDPVVVVRSREGYMGGGSGVSVGEEKTFGVYSSGYPGRH